MQQRTYAAFSLSVTEGIRLITMGSQEAMDMVVAESMRNGILAQSVEVQDPAEKNPRYSASKWRNHVVLIGPVGGGWEVYGPFEKDDVADRFADSSSEDTDFTVLSVKRD
jgi:hypothetical protein